MAFKVRPLTPNRIGFTLMRVLAFVSIFFIVMNWFHNIEIPFWYFFLPAVLMIDAAWRYHHYEKWQEVRCSIADTLWRRNLDPEMEIADYMINKDKPTYDVFEKRWLEHADDNFWTAGWIEMRQLAQKEKARMK